MLKSFFAKRRQKHIKNSENPFEMFHSYLDHLKNDTPEEHEGMHYELLTVSHLLISTEFESPVEQFNSGSAVFFDLPSIHRQMSCQGDIHNQICTYELHYKDKSISWQNTPNPVDSEFEVFMLSQLVADEIEIRLDVLSNGQDDRYFFALTSDIWQQLENEFGKDFVQSHFEPMPKEFYEPDYEFTVIS